MKRFVFITALFLSAALFMSCASSDVKGNVTEDELTAMMNEAKARGVPLEEIIEERMQKEFQSTAEIKQASSESVAKAPAQKKAYKGEGLVIAVAQPEFSGAAEGEQWIPQYFQDSLTGKISAFSKMTVVDRANMEQIVAEQGLAESGFYSEENAVQIGQMTNARLGVFGKVLKIGGGYELNFRVNDIETNEVKTSVNSRYSFSEIENETAVNETARALLEGLGIELSASELESLAKTNKTENSGAMNLAKGNLAEKKRKLH